MDATILTGDVLQQLKTLADGSVQCVVTSPPYWGLRDYGTAGQLGLEPTPGEYVAGMVAVFEEVRRVLRPDGTLWLNLGDSYASNPSWGRGGGSTLEGRKQSTEGGSSLDRSQAGLKPKDLVGIPWRVAFALQDAGWWLRADIIWAKRAPMPESVRDRPTRSHEHVFLLTKSARYFYDADAVREAKAESTLADNRDNENGHRRNRAYPGAASNGGTNLGGSKGGRNQRDVWVLGPEPYPEAHFATFPTEIPRRAILAGTSARGCCPACGAPWRRVVERTGHVNKREPAHQPNNTPTKTDSTGWQPTTRSTNTWMPTCYCGKEIAISQEELDADQSLIDDFEIEPFEPVPCTVLDPFLGSGTTLAVARELGRDGIGIELNPEYVDLARQRIDRVQAPLPLAL